MAETGSQQTVCTANITVLSQIERCHELSVEFQIELPALFGRVCHDFND